MSARNFEKTTSSKARLSHSEAEALRGRKGKRNKTQRNERHNWEE